MVNLRQAGDDMPVMRKISILDVYDLGYQDSETRKLANTAHCCQACNWCGALP